MHNNYHVDIRDTLYFNPEAVFVNWHDTEGCKVSIGLGESFLLKTEKDSYVFDAYLVDKFVYIWDALDLSDAEEALREEIKTGSFPNKGILLNSVWKMSDLDGRDFASIPTEMRLRALGFLYGRFQEDHPQEKVLEMFQLSYFVSWIKSQ